MQIAIGYFRDANPNTNELTVEDSVRLLRQIKSMASIGITEFANKQDSNEEKQQLKRDIEYVTEFMNIIIGTFMKGNQSTLLLDGVVVSEHRLERVRSVVSEETRKADEFLSNALEKNSIIDNEIAYNLKDLLSED